MAAEGAAYGGLQGFGEGEGGLEQRLQSAKTGAETGAILAPVVGGGVSAVVGAGKAAGRAISEAGYGRKAPITDAAGNVILGSDNQPVTATSGVARVAGQQIADTAQDSAAVRNALSQPTEIVPGSQPTTFQATGDMGLGQKELELRNTPGAGNTPGPSQKFMARANDQNAARVGAVAGSAPADASSADLVNGLTEQQKALQAQQEAAAAQRAQGTLQNVGGATDSTPTQAGGDLRGAIDQARAPAVQQADQAVQAGQQSAQGSLDALGGRPAGDAATAQQTYGQTFRAPLVSGDQSAAANVSRLDRAIDPDGKLNVDMTPIRAAAADVTGKMPQNAAPLAGDEKAIFDTAQNLPDVQPYRELSALNTRVTSAMRTARSDPKADPGPMGACCSSKAVLRTP